jgi:hypothetical protein
MYSALQGTLLCIILVKLYKAMNLSSTHQVQQLLVSRKRTRRNIARTGTTAAFDGRTITLPVSFFFPDQFKAFETAATVGYLGI